ncbi:MFS transporter [Clostridium aminobutyricum]|uniref:MFS transporter n=1 Tax=Clostridium aminobutyricum TaxID=33953 RepID=A0A939D5Q5_CLOAM|nr:MFS transporter [Clostridium aminobutyricum]MBN7771759.1 MFS transporter [Clostridium aminobutyricum]
MDTQKLWTKNFILAALSGLFAAMVFYITMTTLAMYAIVSFRASASIAGLIASIFVLGGVFGRLFSGQYMERIGRRKFILSGCFLFFLASVAYLLPLGIVSLLIIRFLHGFTFGSIHNALSTVVLGFIPPNRRGEGIGYFSLNFTVATAFGPFIGMFIVHAYSYTILFTFCAFSAFLCLLSALFVKIETPVFTEEQTAHLKEKFTFKAVFERSALPLAFVIFFMSLCYAGVTAFLNSFAAELNLTYMASIFFLVYGVAILLFRPLAGKLLDKKGDNIVMLPTIAFYAASLFTLTFAQTKTLFLLAAILMALGYGNILNMGQTIAVKSVDSHKISTATSTYFIFSDAGMGLGPLLMGLFVTWKGYAFMFLIEAVIVTLSILLYYGLHGRHPHAKGSLV